MAKGVYSLRIHGADRNGYNWSLIGPDGKRCAKNWRQGSMEDVRAHAKEVVARWNEYIARGTQTETVRNLLMGVKPNKDGRPRR